MMRRKAVIQLLSALTILAGVGLSQEATAAEHTIKIGTLAPKSSPWGKVFETWVKAVSEKSGGRLEITIFYNGSQGDEKAMVGKMKAGQLDAAAITSVGLSAIYKPFLALQMPGLFSSWAQLDKARESMKGDFDKGAADAGFTILGSGDVGRAYVMSKGFELRTPDNLKNQKPYKWRDDESSGAVFQVIGGVTPVPLSIPELLPQLNTGAVNVVIAPALAAEQLQWSSKLDHISSEPVGFAIGALVSSSKKLDSLPADLKTILVDTGKVAAGALTSRIRAEDDAAYGRLKGKMTVVTLTSSERDQWKSIFKQTRQRLGQGTFSADLVARLEGMGG